MAINGKRKKEYVVRTKDLVKEFTMGGQTLQALKGIQLDIYRGEYISIMGPSGSGKSTLFNMVGGLDKPTTGTVFINDVDMAQLDAQELAYLRCRTIGYIFQSFNLIPVMTALENVTLPMIFAGMPHDEGIERGDGAAEDGRARRQATTTSPRSSPADSSSASPSPARWPTTRPSSSPTSPPATSTSRPARRSSTSSRSSTRRRASRSSPPPTTSRCSTSPTASSGSVTARSSESKSARTSSSRSV